MNGAGRVPRLAPASAGAELEGAALRVLLVSRDAMIAEALDALVDEPGEVSMLDWRADGLELALHHADVVIIDVPPSLYQRTFAAIDGRFLGRTVVLLQEGESEEALPPAPSRVVLYRPLQIADLWAAVAGAVQPAATGEAANGAGPGATPPEQPTPPPEPPTPTPMIGWSGRELEPVLGPGQIAPGMDPDTLERLRRWHERARTAGAASARRTPAARALPGWLAGLARPAVVVALAGVVALGTAGWRAEGGPDLLAGEVATAQAARSLAHGPGLLLPDPRVGPVTPVHALAVGAWLRPTGAETKTTLEADVRAARAPSRALLAGVVALTVLLSLLLMRVGPGTGAAAGPGPAPPQAELGGRDRGRRLGAVRGPLGDQGEHGVGTGVLRALLEALPQFPAGRVGDDEDRLALTNPETVADDRGERAGEIGHRLGELGGARSVPAPGVRSSQSGQPAL